MLEIIKYNPCEEYIETLNQLFADKLNSAKVVTFLYDNKKIHTNLMNADIKGLIPINDFNYDFSSNGLLIINLSDSFYIEKISECPRPKKYLVDDIYYDGIIKRMFAQIEFGFYYEGNITAEGINICDNVFKAIYTKSLSIKRKNIELSVKKFNSLQKEGYINESIIYSIIYAIYNYFNSKQHMTK